MISNDLNVTFTAINAITELALDEGIDHVVNKFDISRKTMEQLLELPAAESLKLCKKLEQFKVIQLDIDFTEVVAIAKLVVNLTFFQYEKLEQLHKTWFSQLTAADLSFKKAIGRDFMEALALAMDDAEKKPKKCYMNLFPPELFVLMQGLKNGKAPVFSNVLIQRDTLKLKINKEALDRLVSSFQEEASSRSNIYKLAMAGADIQFIKLHGINNPVDANYFRFCQRICPQARKVKAVPAKLIFDSFLSQLKEEKSTISIYLDLHHKFDVEISQLNKVIQGEIIKLNSAQIKEIKLNNKSS